MRKTILICLLSQLAVSVFAASRMTVEKLNSEIASSRGKQDAKIASRLSGLELTERLSAAKLADMEKALPGPDSRRALLTLADQATFLNPPPAEIPNEPAPTFEQQRVIMAKTIDYVITMVHRLPNLFANRDTIHFEDTPPGLGDGSFRGNVVTGQPLHPVSRTSETVLYRDGQDFVRTAGKESAASTSATAGLTTFGEFGPILATVLSDLPRGKLAWSRWEKGSVKPVAVFGFSVPKAASHYQIRFCCGNDGPFRQPSGYHGEIMIEPENGTILRLTLIADLGKDDPLRKANLMVEYGPVELAGRTYFCPMRSVSISLARRFGSFKGSPGLFSPEDIVAAAPLQPMLNEVVFDHYHLFHSDSRVLIAGDSEPTFTSAASANDPSATAETSALNSGAQPLATSENPASSASAASSVPANDEKIPAVSKITVPSEVGTTPVVPSKPEISLVQPTDLPTTPSLSAIATNQPGYSFRVSTRLVDVGVTAYDKKGRPIADLTGEDFVISDNHKKQVLRSFSRGREEPAASLPSKTAAQPILYSNRHDAKRSVQSERTCSDTSTVVVLDATNLGDARLTRVREQISKFLDQLPASESIALYVRKGDGFRVLAEGTANHYELVSALQGWRPHSQELAAARKAPSRTMQLAEATQLAGDMNYMNGTIGGSPEGTRNVSSVWEIPGANVASAAPRVDSKLLKEASDRTRQLLNSIGAVAAHLGANPGRKNLVWLAGDGALVDWTEQTAGSNYGPYSLAGVALRTLEALNDARVSLFPMGASQIETAALDASLQINTVQLNSTLPDGNSNGSLGNVSTLPDARAGNESRQNSRSVQGAFQQMAEATGGRSFAKSENVVSGLISVIEDRRASYLLSFTPATQPDDRFHWLTISVPTRRGITLRNRSGYLYSKEPTTLKDRFEQAIWQPLDATEIALTVRRAPASGGAAVSLNIAASDISLAEQGDRRTGKLDIFLVQRDRGGMRADVNEQTLALDLKPATYQRVLRDGIPFDQYLDEQQISETVRVIVVDENSGHIGSITLPASTASIKP
jgi:VWFA-related protein